MNNRKVLLLTGRLCASPINKLIDHKEVDVLELPIEVAALMSKELIQGHLEEIDLFNYEYILLPGSLKVDVKELSEKTGIPIYLGPTHFLDIPIVLKNLKKQQLSMAEPADLILSNLLKKRTKDFYNKSIENQEQKKPAVVLGKGSKSVKIGCEFPTRVIGEIVNAPSKNIFDILLEAKHLASSGASVIDIGMTPGTNNAEFIDMIVPLLKRDLNIPISIDTMREDEILAASEAGIDLILSICGATLDIVPSVDVPVVIVPLESPESMRPRLATEKLEMISRFADRLEDHALILDPLLEPIGLGFSESISAYLKLSSRLPGLTSLMGAGNVTELLDADSIGVNALLAALATEIGSNLILTTENSPKTRGSVGELNTACQMMFFSRENSVPPKNLGLNLLKYKEKKSYKEPISMPRVKIRATEDSESQSFRDGAKFHISVHDSQIHTIYRDINREIDFIGKSAKIIADELERQGIIPDSRHAFYLGSELSKAEMALQLSRSYIQDRPLFEEDNDGENQD